MKTSKLRVLALISSAISISACGKAVPTLSGPIALLPEVGVPDSSGAVVHGRAVAEVGSDQTTQTAALRMLESLFSPRAWADASGSTTVTYSNSPSTTFAINVSSLLASGWTGTRLSLGTVSLSSLSDNNLKVCGAGGNTKCNSAVIRVYTTGTTSGFVNTADAYGAPVYAGTLNPNTPVGLNAAGSVQVQTLALPSTKRTTSLADFPSPSYPVSADFSNAGAGSYSMTFVVEYALLP